MNAEEIRNVFVEDRMADPLTFRANGVPDNLEPTETAKSILENMDEILNVLSEDLHMIDKAVSGQPVKNEDATRPQEGDGCMLQTLQRQRTKASDLLIIADHIRTRLW